MKRIALVLLVVVAAILTSQTTPQEQVGPLASGGFLLNSGWRLLPAGRQVPLSTFPMSSAMSPDGKYLLVLNGGYLPPTISVLDPATEKELSRTPVTEGWLGLTFSPKGDFVYVGGGSQASIFEFAFADGKLEPARTFVVVPKEKRTGRDFIGDVTFDPSGRLLYASDLYHDSILVINPQSGTVIDRFPTGRRPYRILFHPDGKSFFTTSWADGTLYHHRTDSGHLIEKVALGSHPTDMIWAPGKPESEEDRLSWVNARLFVAAANTNNVYELGITEAGELRRIETINISMTPWQPAGMTPSAFALSPDGKRLFTVCSDVNALAVADISASPARPLGFIPTGWYPTAARVLKDGRIIVLNGKGLRSFPNLQGPSPFTGSGPQYGPRMQTGTVSFIDPPSDEQLLAYSKTVLENSPYRDSLLEDAGTGPDNPVPAKLNQASPIKHVIYILKENRTYDQMLGDMKEGNGDPSLVLFGEDVTPNHHKLAREFVLLDNFYVNADVSADGHNWSDAAIAPDYVVKLWPNSYAGRRRTYDYEGGEPAAVPPSGYIWTNAAAAGITMRNYGHFAENRAKPGTDGVQIDAVLDPVLNRVTNLKFRSFDMDYPDLERVKVFFEDLAEFEKAGEMPHLILMRLCNDHTSGTSAGKIAPLSAVADNDAALGQVVEAVSKSRFWKDTAIFVMEDDAQNGADHVDSHRSPAFVISPYTKRHAVVNLMYNTTSMLRTMELILGLRPMTTFDAGARPMSAVFQATPDFALYEAEKPRISLTERNPAKSATAERSAKLDFSAADRIDDNELNEILWIAIRGTQAPPPAPVRSLFAR